MPHAVAMRTNPSPFAEGDGRLHGFIDGGAFFRVHSSRIHRGAGRFPGALPHRRLSLFIGLFFFKLFYRER